MDRNKLKIKAKTARSKITISSRIDNDIVDRLNQLSEQTGYSRSQLINLSLREIVFRIDIH